ncbi:MAG TPA: S1C family serine protease [Bryobacteraceae bacterium]|nr:S1C family serine protease [Bryobacteraceae bacterium]
MIAVSQQLADAVERAGKSVVAVSARPRLASSGVVWRDGIVVTADHTIRRTEEITVSLPDGRTLAAALAGRDSATDLAVLKVEGAGLPVPEFATGPLAVGSLVLAVGRSPETGANASLGVISSLAGPWRTWRGGRVDRFVRLDLSLYPGSSGSAIIDAQGRALGLATTGLSRSAPLAIPAATVERVLAELLTRGHIARGYLGLGLQPVVLPEHLSSRLNLPERGGVIVLSVEPAGPAERAGVVLGDVLVALRGQPVRDTDDVQAFLETEFVGQAVPARILRAGVLTEFPITIGERPRREE